MPSIATTYTPFLAAPWEPIEEVVEYLDREPGNVGRWAWVRFAHNGRRVIRRLDNIQVQAVA